MGKKLSQTFRRGLLMLATTAIMLSASAVPAKPGLTRKINLTNGTTLTARLVGDEHGHYWVGDDGKAYLQGDDGNYQPVDRANLSAKAAARRHQANARRSNRIAPRKVGQWGNYTGKKKGIVILVNFKNKSFNASNNNALYQRITNEKDFSYGNFKGSVRDYFYKQSEGKFELEFDVVGPVTVSRDYSYYGANSGGYDKYPATMVIEALKLVDDQVNFADYDWDGDGEVDQVYVIYAGKGEADGGSSSTIWPHEWTLTDANEYGDGSGRQELDNVFIDTYACGAELDGSTGTIAGIGTMCHEFSHCLGYPDFYDTDDSGGQGMDRWDLMDYGSYNGNSFQPAGFTSYERWVAGWKEPIVLSATKTVTGMKSLQDDGESFIIYNNGNRNEYFLLENRQLTGWDASLPGKGLLILHVDYDKTSWENNTPNDDPSHQRMTWIPADNKYKYTDLKGLANDPFPYNSVNAFGKTTTPAAKLFNKNSDGSYYLDSSVENITQNADGTISFKFVGLYNVATPTFSPAAGTYAEAQTVIINCETEGAVIHYTIDGTTPTVSSTIYSEPITVEQTTTIKAIAIANGEESGVATAKYTIRSGAATDANTFKLATSIDEITDGKRCIIARGDKQVAAGSLYSGRNNYLLPTDVTVEDDIITINDDVTVFTLEGSGNSYSLANSDGQYLYAQSAKNVNYSSDANTWTLQEVNDGVTLSFGNYGTMLYNVNTPRFTTYTSATNVSMLYAQIYIEYDGTPTPTKQDATLTFSATSATGILGQPFTAPTLTTDPEGISVAYTSSYNDVATIDATTGMVTLVGIGTTIITASFAGNAYYNEAEASYTLTVEEAVNTGETKYVLVESTDELKAGEEYIIVGSHDGNTYYALSTTQNTNNRAATKVTMNSDGTITGNDDVQDITLESSGDKWLFYVGTGYLYAASSSKNYLRTEVDYDDNATATISIGQTAEISFCGDNSRNKLKFNINNGQPIFSCYSSGQDNVMLYHKVVEEETKPLKGDANGDGEVSVADIMLTVNFVLQNDSEGFVFDNADIDENGEISIADVMSIVDIVMKQK